MPRTYALLFLMVLVQSSVEGQFKKISFQQPKMGSLFSLVLYATDSVSAARAATHTFTLIDTLNNVYSDYLPESELNRLCAQSGSGEWVPVSETLFSILEQSVQAAKMSKGAFDITTSPIVRLWRTARKEKRLPHADSIQAAKNRTGFRNIELDAVGRRVRLRKAGMQLDLGGIAKGETAQRAHDRLVSLGFPYCLVDAGGDIVAGDVPPGIPGWKVAVNLPQSEETMNSYLLLRNMAVTTSGDLYQYLEVDGKRYSHIIDPRSGRALTNARNVTVIAPKGIDADWLTKACSIMPLRQAIRLVKKVPFTAVQIAIVENNQPIFYRSGGFNSYLQAVKN